MDQWLESRAGQPRAEIEYMESDAACSRETHAMLCFPDADCFRLVVVRILSNLYLRTSSMGYPIIGLYGICGFPSVECKCVGR